MTFWARIDEYNPWILSVDFARRRWPGWLAALVGAGLFVAAVPAGRWAAGRLVQALDPAVLAPPLAPLAPLLAAYLCVLGPLWLLVLAFLAWEARQSRGVGATHRLLAGLVGAVTGLMAMALSLALAWAGHAAVLKGGASGTAASLGLAFGLTVFQAGVEELFFRGWLQPALGARWGAWMGLVATSVLFAGVHLLGAATPVAMVNITLGGLMFGLLALRTGSLAAPVAAHVLWNFADTHLLGLTPNPGVDPRGSLLDIDLVGPPLWSGGAEGTNASLAATLALLVVVVGLGALRGQMPAARAASTLSRAA